MVAQVLWWSLGDHVKKREGVKFNGYIVAIFENRKGEPRLVIESDTIEGLLHIYPPHMFEKI